LPKSTAKKTKEGEMKNHFSMLLKMKLPLYFTQLKHERRSNFLHFFGPSGLSILPDLLCWWGLDVHAYDGAPTA